MKAGTRIMLSNNLSNENISHCSLCILATCLTKENNKRKIIVDLIATIFSPRCNIFDKDLNQVTQFISTNLIEWKRCPKKLIQNFED